MRLQAPTVITLDFLQPEWRSRERNSRGGVRNWADAGVPGSHDEQEGL